MNEGQALTSYVGHSAPTVWSFEPLFTTVDASALSNAGKPTVVAQWGCWTTYHVSPSYDTLWHKLLTPGKGAAAAMGSTAPTESNAEIALGQLMMGKLTAPGATIGQAMVAAKHELAAQRPELRGVLKAYTLLGDPALVIKP
ncbi:MAG: C25 family cysteine peptidase [Chloroflexota bacterium]